MADLALSAAQTLFAALQCEQVKEFCNLLGYKTHLKDLEITVSTVKKVLIGAEVREGELSPEEEDYIEKLKEAVYDADDLFDEVLALSELNKYKKGGKKVRLFFSSLNPLSVAYNVSKQIKLVRKELEDIANNHNKFGLKFDSQPIRKTKPETYSFLNEIEVIGRESETEEVIARLLECNSKEEVGFLSIVGVGGLGKTTLAQLVYNDERIVKEFSGSKYWICVSDHDKDRFDVKVILSKILELVTGQKPGDGSSMEMVQCHFKEALGGKKCLVILDDIWNEDRCKWLELRSFLMILGRESRILTTTRSRGTAAIIGNGNTRTYELRGLSPENSWRLFVLMAFGCEPEDEILTDFVEIGHKIVVKCSCVPLALKVVGSLLFGQEKSKWDAFETMEVTSIRKGDNYIMSILKFSYLNLEPPLKSCFKYCAMFPKDFKMEKEMLIRLWDAQGYIIPFEVGQSIQDAGEEYFSILLKRSFFEDVQKDQFGEILSCKIHDLMHDLVEEVAIHEIWRSNYMIINAGEKVRHLAHYQNVDTKRFPFSSKIRSCIIHCSYEGVGTMVENWKRLRVLELHDPNIKALPDTIGDLLHLRSLDISNCGNLLALPNWITKLQNLQTLDVSNCYGIEELPKTLSKLEKLKHLNFLMCPLTHMPSRMDKLSCLTYLSDFIVNEGNDSSENQHVGELKDLQFLTELRGRITVFVKNYGNNGKKTEEEGYLKRLRHLKDINISFEHNGEMESDDKALMEKLEPHSNLRSISLSGYKCSEIPNWGRSVNDWATILPGLVKIQLYNCQGMEKLPLLSRLLHLNRLNVYSLRNLEYMEDPSAGTVSSKGSIFFPSLVHLQLSDLTNLKGWWSNHMGQPCFPRLYSLQIWNCPNLASFPSCPTLKSLFLSGCNQSLRISLGDNNIINPTEDVLLREVKIDKLDYLRSTHMERVAVIRFDNAREMVTTSEAEEVLKRCSSSLRSLEFYNCNQLTSISGGLEHLSLLESLTVINSPDLRFDEQAQPWRSLSHSLRSLRLTKISNAASLPKGLHYLTKLQRLFIEDWPNLESLPEWISSISSLTYLYIQGCGKIKSLPKALSKLSFLHRLEVWGCSNELEERCQQDPQGDDWPQIRHIPHFTIHKTKVVT